MAEVHTKGDETDDGGPWWHTEVRAALEDAHKRGWNDACAEMELTTRKQLTEGQKVTREDVIRTIRLLADHTQPGEAAIPVREYERRAGVNPDGSLK